MELKNKGTVHLIGGNKTAYNLYYQLIKNGINAKAYVFEKEYMYKRNHKVSFIKDWTSCSDLPDKDKVIITSETAFFQLPEKDRLHFNNHYFLRDKLNLEIISKKIEVQSLGEIDLNNSSISFPIIAKPKESGADKVPFKFKVNYNREELESLISIKDHCIFQKYLDPKEYKQIAIAGYFTGHPESLISVEQLNHYPIGISALIKYCKGTESCLIANISKFLNEIDYKGFIEFEFKVDKNTGNMFLLDINPRTWGWSNFYIEGITNFPEVIFENIKPNLSLKDYWMNLPRLILANKNGRFANPKFSKFVTNKITYEPYFRK